MTEKKTTTAPPKPRKKAKKRRPGGRKHSVMAPGPEATKREQTNRATFRGFMRYIQRPGASIRQVWEDERIDDSDTAPFIRDVISWSAFQKSSINGKWRIRREEHWRAVKRKVLDHAQTEAVKSEIAEIGALEAVRGLVLDRITGNAAAGITPALPKSLEGAVGAFVQLDKRISQKRDIVVEQTADAATKHNQSGAHGALTERGVPLITVGDNPLTDEEIERMSRALATHRAGLSPTEDPAVDRIELPGILKKSPEDTDDQPAEDQSKAVNAAAASGSTGE